MHYVKGFERLDEFAKSSLILNKPLYLQFHIRFFIFIQFV